jgi:IS1 family transposase
VSIAKAIQQPPITTKQIYEIDEVRSLIRCKKDHMWIVYALNRKTKEVVSYNIGARTGTTLNHVLENLRFSNTKRIYTIG